MLRKYGNVTALELNDEAISELKEKFGGQIDIIKWKSPEKINRKFDLILLADVLEHIPDDREAVSWIYEHLNEEGYALLTVPAHQFFWTQMDEVVGHYRRYSRKNFLKLFENKFSIKKFSFYNFFLFPVKIVFTIFARTVRCFSPQSKRSYNDLVPQLKLINIIFKYILYLESKLMRRISFPLGVSMILLVQKNSFSKK